MVSVAQDERRVVVANFDGDDVRLAHLSERARLADADVPHEVLQGVFVSAPVALVADVRKPLELGRDVSQALESDRRSATPPGGILKLSLMT